MNLNMNLIYEFKYEFKCIILLRDLILIDDIYNHI